MRLLKKIRNLVGRGERLRRLEEEMHTHVDLLTEEGVRQGLERSEARRRAHLAFGNVLATREQTEDALGWPMLESLWHDGRVAARGLVRRPLFTLSLVAVLALGIGATTAVYSLVRGVMFEPLPVAYPEELHLVANARGEPFQLSAPTVERLNTEPAFRGRVAAYSDLTGAALRLEDAPPEPVRVQFVHAGFFSALGLVAERGRLLGEADRAPGTATAVVSHAFWRTKLGGDDAAVGRAVRLNGVDVLVVGVAPASFAGVSLGEAPDFWLPLPLHATLRCSPSAWIVSSGGVDLAQWVQGDNVMWLTALVRPPADAGAAADRVRAAWVPQLDAVLRIVSDPRTQGEFRRDTPALVPSPRGHSDTRDDFRRSGVTLMLLVGAVVLVTVANTATLLLLRMLGRGRELGVRLALGAGPWRLARAALAEGLLLSFAGALLGLLLGTWLTPVLGAWLVPGALAQLPGLDWSLAGGLAVLALLLGLAVGAAPAWLGARLSPQVILQQRLLSAGGSLRLGRLLIVAQLGLSVLLIAIAGALALDLRRVLTTHPGYDRTTVVQGFFNLSAAGIPVEKQAALLERLRAAARELPQVREVGFAASGVLSGSRSRSGIYFRGDGVRQPKDSVQHENIDAGYLSAMGLTLLRGRGISGDDVEGRPPVALISERLAREVFGPADPIGRRLGYDETATEDDKEIVGVVADARVNGVREEPPPLFYTALTQWRARPTCIVIRVQGDATAVRAELARKISAAEPGVMFTRWATLEERAARLVRNDQSAINLTAGFGLLSVVLATIGVFGALGYLVASRSREFAVRLAIGADPATIWRGVLRDAALLGAGGAALGLALSLALPHWLGAWMMTGLRTDWRAVAAAVVAGLAAAAVGGWLPARRAARVDPLTLLKSD